MTDRIYTRPDGLTVRKRAANHAFASPTWALLDGDHMVAWSATKRGAMAVAVHKCRVCEQTVTIGAHNGTDGAWCIGSLPPKRPAAHCCDRPEYCDGSFPCDGGNI